MATTNTSIADATVPKTPWFYCLNCGESRAFEATDRPNETTARYCCQMCGHAVELDLDAGDC